ncbi:MAG: OB-fold nucleic acid binding domain-containing protein, partial [Candidatus Altiarchaeota archaeon]|nr:OB-fold nucleic acid binding domain-containing protein [Candidatus Altiarchaeota archaeon]
ELFERVVAESGKPPQEIKEMIEKRKEATHGLLSDYGALYAVAKEFGMDIDMEKIIITKLSDVTPQKAFNLVGRIKTILPPKEFKRKDGSTGKIASIIFLDKSSESRLVLWDNNVEIANRAKKGDTLMVRNGYGKEGLNGNVEIHAGSLTHVLINPKLKIDLPKIKEEFFKIDKLKKDLPSVDLICRVSNYYPATEFKRSDGSEGLRASFISEDETGSIRVTLWGEAAKTPLERGDFVRIENAYTREGMNQELELQVGNRSRIMKTDEILELEPLPGIKELKIGEITPNTSGFSTVGRVIRTYPPRPYSNGMLASLILGDSSGTTRAVLWNEKSEVANELKRGDVIRIKNAYSKTNLNNEPEIHVGKYGEVVLNQDLNIASLKDIEKSLITEKKIADLGNNDRYVRIKGRIVDLDEGRRLIYMTCSNCNKRVQNLGANWFCESCNEDVEPSPNLVISVTVEDETGSSIKAVSFRENAEKIMEVDIEEVMNIIGETQDELAPLTQMKDDLIDKKVSLLGRVRYSDYSDQLEFIVDEVEMI